uniref:Protein FAM135B-like n=1 Tax=Rhizophora mucronata TaxID=61149 RepID=A0A2P2MUS1_RHIMU
MILLAFQVTGCSIRGLGMIYQTMCVLWGTKFCICGTDF